MHASFYHVMRYEKAESSFIYGFPFHSALFLIK